MQEVKLQGQDTSFLSAEYRDVLENAERYVDGLVSCGVIMGCLCNHGRHCMRPCVFVRLCRYQKEYKNQPRALEMLYGLVTDLFVDRQKFKGHDVRTV